ncbi:MAG: hypothetical protein KDK70_15490, partial [Myxococcales bacterium]|nr:hypothetical protein [Myxococcales bacterium]
MSSSARERWSAHDVDEASAPAAASIPPHRAVALPGLHAYPEAPSVARGGRLHLHVSSRVPYRLSVWRLGPDVEHPFEGEPCLRQPPSPAIEQPIHPGSYVHARRALPATEPLHALSLECWVRPWSTAHWAGLLTQYDYPTACGVGLFVAPGGG